MQALPCSGVCHSLGDLEASLGGLFLQERGITQRLQWLIFAGILSHIVGVQRCIYRGVRVDCSDPSSSPAADSLSNAKMLIIFI